MPGFHYDDLDPISLPLQETDGVIIARSNQLFRAGTVAELGRVIPDGENLIMNPIMEINQRKVLHPTDHTYGPDRWIILTEGTAVQVGNGSVDARVAMATAGKFGAGYIQNDTSARCGMHQIVQVSDVQNRRGESVALGAELFQNSGSTKNAVVWIREWTGNGDDMPKEQVANWAATNFTSGGGYFVTTTTTTLDYVTVSVPSGVDTPMPDLATQLGGAAINLSVGYAWLDGLPQGTRQAWRPVLSPGKMVRPFKKRPHMLEWAACRQFYQTSFPYQVTPANGTGLFEGAMVCQLTATGQPVAQQAMTPPFVVGTWRDFALYNPRAGGTAGRWATTAGDGSAAANFMETTHSRVTIGNSGTAQGAGLWRVHWMGTVDPGTTNTGTGV